MGIKLVTNIKMAEIATFELKLDEPAATRWNHILLHYKDHFPKIRTEVDNLLRMFGYNTFIGYMLNGAISLNQGSIMYYEELASISGLTGIAMDKLLIVQLLYEINAGCTTVVAEVEGKCTMFRTMDWPMDFLKDITINLNCTNKGKTVYRATTWVGYVGILTGYSEIDKYAVAINYRKNTTPSIMGLLQNIIMLRWPVGYLVRDTLEKSNYENALYRFNMSSLISPTYITIAKNVDDCHLLVRDYDRCTTVLSRLPLIQTNVDFDKSAPDILFSNKRRALCSEIFERDDKSLADYSSQLDIFPIQNAETIYTNVIIPETGYFTTKVSR